MDSDSPTVFPMSEKMSKVGARRYPRLFASKGRDIPLRFRGVPARIARAGMAVEPVKAAPSSDMRVIMAPGANPLAPCPLLMREPARIDFERRATFAPKNGMAFLSLDHIRKYDVDALSCNLDYRDALAASQMACEDMIKLYKENRQKMKELLKRMTDQFYARELWRYRKMEFAQIRDSTSALNYADKRKRPARLRRSDALATSDCPFHDNDAMPLQKTTCSNRQKCGRRCDDRPGQGNVGPCQTLFADLFADEDGSSSFKEQEWIFHEGILSRAAWLVACELRATA